MIQSCGSIIRHGKLRAGSGAVLRAEAHVRVGIDRFIEAVAQLTRWTPEVDACC